MNKVLITGAGGYVGALLVPELLEQGYRIVAYDLFLYGRDVLPSHPNLELVQADIRNREQLETALVGVDSVLHLACISNDPSFELDPTLGRSINYDAFAPLVDACKEAGVRRFIYASSSSVYGVKEEPLVTEDLLLEPLTDYSKYKAMCEEILWQKHEPGFCCLVVRPATVCGWSPRLRLDLTVNILTNHAINNKRIKVFGGAQQRPNIHIRDMVRFYCAALKWSEERIDGKTYNLGYDNYSIMEIAEQVREVVGPVEIEVTPTDDLRSYRICSQKIADELGFTPRHSLLEAIEEIAHALRNGKVPNAMSDKRYYNIKTMQEVQLT